MKILLCRSVLFLSLFFLLDNTQAQEGKASFWAHYLEGDYDKAAEAGKTLGKELSEYYFLAAVSYHNVFEYRQYHILKNRYLQSTQDFSKLKDLLEEKEAQNRDNFQIYLLMGITKRFLPEIPLKDAKSYFEKSIALNEKNPYAYNYLSMMNFEERNLSEAIKHAKKAIKLKPDFPEPYNNLAVAYERQGEKNKAVDVLLECLKKCPISPSATFQNLIHMTRVPFLASMSPAGKKQMRMVPFIEDEKIRNKLKKALESRPRHYLALEEEFLKHSSVPELRRFLAEFECPEELKNEYNYIKARYAYLTGDEAEFDRLVKSLLSNGFTDYRRLKLIGTIYFSNNRYEEAIQICEYALQHVDPLDKDFELKLTSATGVSYLGKKDYERARIWLNKALAIKPHDVISLDNLAQVYLLENNFSKAKELLLLARKHVSSQDEFSKQNINNTLDHIDMQEFRNAIMSGKEIDVNQQNARGITPLMIAAGSGLYMTVKSFLEKGADVNARSLGDSIVVDLPFGPFTASNQPLFVVDGIIFNTDTNTGDQTFTTDSATVSSRFLDLDSNSIVSISILKGLSATVLYGEAGRNGVVLVTTKNGTAGAGAQEKMEFSFTQGVYSSEKRSGKSLRIIKKILGGTAIQRVAANGHTEILKLLLENGADISDGLALYEASEKGYTKIVNILLEHGVDVNVEVTKSRSRTRTTALIAAAEFGQTDIVKLLLDHDADVNAKCFDWSQPATSTQHTALSLASWNGYQEIINLLKQAGAAEQVAQPRREIDPYSIVLKPSSGESDYVQPKPKGGFAAIQRNLIYPEEARRDSIQGEVIVRVLVTEEGNVEKTTILKSLRPDCDEAAIRAIEKTEWKPAEQKSKPVKTWVPIPVIFKLVPNINEASLEFNNGNYHHAIKIYTEIIKSQESEYKFDAFYGRARCYYKLKNYKNAKSDVKKLLKIKRNNKDYNRIKGNSYWLYSLIVSKEVSTSKSLKLLKKSSKYIQSSSLFSDMGYDEIYLGKYDDAIINLNNAIQLDSINAWAFSNRALAYLKQNKFDLARIDVNKSFQLDNKNPFAYKHSALIYIALKDFESACIDLNKAKELSASKRMVEYGLEEISVLIKKYCETAVNKK